MTRYLSPLLLLAVACEPVVGDPGRRDPADVPSVLQVSPEVVGRGQRVTIALTTEDAPFELGDLRVDLGDGLEVADVWTQDGAHAFATVDVDPDAELGLRDVSVRVGDWAQVRYGAVRVIAESFAIDPGRAGRGEIVEVSLEGVGTSWDGSEWPVFGKGVDVLDLTVTDQTHAVAVVGVAPDAEVGRRDVTMGDLTLYDGFTVDADVISMTIECPPIPQGDIADCEIAGLGTHWEPGTVVELWDGGGHNPDVFNRELKVLSETDIFVRFQASNAAAVGMRDLVVRTGDQSLFLPDAVEVIEVVPGLEKLAVSLGWDVSRTIDQRGRVDESGHAFVAFVVPLDPPCGAVPPRPGSGALPFDNPVVFVDPPEGGTEDCPNPKTVDAGETVLLRAESASLVLHRETVRSTGQIVYRASDKAAQDYVFDESFDLVVDGSGDVPAVEVPDVLRTVPADVVLTGPGYGPHDREQGLPVSWVPASTYPDSTFSLYVQGQIDGRVASGGVGVIPWDDGEYLIPPEFMDQLAPGDVRLYAYSFKEGREFGLPFSDVQSNQADSKVTVSKVVSLY